MATVHAHAPPAAQAAAPGQARPDPGAAPAQPGPGVVTASARVVFDAWAGEVTSPTRPRLNARSVLHYRSIWFNFVKSLPAHIPWEQAGPEHVSAYLNQLTPSATARLKLHNISDKPASSVTRRRYWRVLREIYARAVILKLCETNACEGATEIPFNEIMASMILPRWALQTIEAGIIKEHKRRADSTWQQIRNDALLLTLLHTAAKTGEMIQLRADQVIAVHTGRAGPQWTVNIDGDKPCQRRFIALQGAAASKIMQRWLEVRVTVPGHSAWLFFGAKSHVWNGTRERSPLSRKSIFFLVAAAIKAHLPANSFESSVLAHTGGETLRNSVLARWLEDGVSLEDVMRRAGVAETRAIFRVAPKPLESEA